jgi:hypothetical protein
MASGRLIQSESSAPNADGQLRTGPSRYVDCVKDLLQDGGRWLDADGSRRIFHDAYFGEHDLVARAARVTVCDADLESLKSDANVKDVICCDLSSIRLLTYSFDLITCR